MSSTFTVNLSLRKPEHRDPETLESWDAVLNDDFDKIDAAFGLRSYTAQNYIANGDSHSQSLNKLDIQLYDVALSLPTANQKAALAGPAGYPPTASNPYATQDWVSIGAPIAKKEVLSPEYPGGVLYDGGVTPTGGTLISDFEFNVANYGFNFYKWISTAVAFETYNVVVRWKVPETFVGFNTTLNKALILDISTEDTGTDSYVGITIQKDDALLVTSSISTISSTVGALWYSERAADELIAFDAADSVLASISAGDVLIITIAMSSQNSKYAKVGDITIQYNG
jgi:hypothetical protein